MTADDAFGNVFKKASNIAKSPEHLEGAKKMKDGIFYCNTCKKPRQYALKFPDLSDGADEDSCYTVVVPIMCDCQRRAYEAEQAREKEEEEIYRRRVLREESYLLNQLTEANFNADKYHETKAGEIARRYVDNWTKVSSENIGLIFHGGVGTGKTFLAACIGNALLDRGISAAMVTVTDILSAGYDDDRNIMIHRLSNKGLLIVDDLGAERDTAFALEWAYKLIDARIKSKKPLIVTTNLTPSEMQAEEDINMRRIFDRVIGACQVPIKLDGASKRGNISDMQKSVIAGLIFGEGKK